MFVRNCRSIYKSGKIPLNDPAEKGFSSVILTLVSLVIALAIEQLLSHVTTQFTQAFGPERLLIAA